MEVYEFWDGDDRKSFLQERPLHVLYLWQLLYTYKILSTVRQQLCSDIQQMVVLLLMSGRCENANLHLS